MHAGVAGLQLTDMKDWLLNASFLVANNSAADPPHSLDEQCHSQARFRFSWP
jgi:hypothetical protein